ncbi:MAG: helix-turn-helix domain-containing protein, partial [Thiohalomonadales bacterium]
DNNLTRLRHTEQLIELLQTTLQSAGNSPSILLNTTDAHKLIKRAQALIEQDVHLGQALSVPDLAYRLDAHERTLYYAFQKNLGISPYTWSHLVRMHQFRQQAVKLLQPHGAVTKIAMEMGFNNLSHFSEQFKRLFGESPRQFLQRCKIPH